MSFNKRSQRLRRARKSAMKIKARAAETGIPRLCVIRSNKNISGQVIDFKTGNVLASASTLQKLASSAESKETSKLAAAKDAGRALGAKLKELGIAKLACDRRGYLYHGRVAAFLDGIREFEEVSV